MRGRMLHLLNLLAGVALLVWGTHIVRTGILRLLRRRPAARAAAEREQPLRRVLRRRSA